MAKRTIRVQDLAKAAQRFYRLGENAIRAADVITAAHAVDVIDKVAGSTPVDTAKARSNWRVSIGHTLRGIVPPFHAYVSRHKPPYGAGGSIGETANRQAVVNLAKTRLSQYKGGTIIIANNAPYINRLNHGHSKQVSPGFIERACADAAKQAGRKLADLFEDELVK